MQIFKNLFKPKKLSIPIDFSLIKTDIHSHLIPGVDDGSVNIDESIKLIKKLNDVGYTKLITTPHINNDFFKNSRSNLQPLFESLVVGLNEQNVSMQLSYAAEYLIDDGFEKRINEKSLLTIYDSYVLVELSYYYPPQNLNALLFELQISGYSIILAHPERYSYWYADFNQLQELKAKDVLFQINLLTLSGHYGKPALQVAEKLIDNNMVDFIGTDLHHSGQLHLLDICSYEPKLDQLIASGKLKNPQIV